MSLLTALFGSKPAESSAAPPQTSNKVANNPAPPAPASSSTTAPNGVIPSDGATPPTESPLDKFKDLWQPDTTQESEYSQQGVDPAKLLEAASKVDFSKSLDQAILAKVAAGGEEAVAALMQALKQQGSQVYGQSMVTTAKIVEQALAQAEEKFAARIPDLIRKQDTRNRVFEDNPAFKNPAVAPLIEAQVQQLAQKYPKASPQELNAMAKEYLVSMAQLISPPKADASSQSKGKTSDNEDWSKYFQ